MEVTGADRPMVLFRIMEVVYVSGDLCTARLGDLEIPGIRLASVEGGAAGGIAVTPARGSAILVADISLGELRELVAVAYSEVDAIAFQGGENGGLVIAGGVAGRLNAIERDLNTLKTVFKSWVTVPNDGGAALKAASAAWAGQQLTETAAGDIENEKIKH